jgi:hypothetical protein
MRANRIPVAVVLALSAGALAGGGASPDQPAKFKITTKRQDDSVEVQAEKGKALFLIKSPFGISQAVIEREGERWPGAMAVRLYLKGLEGFRASNGKATLQAAVSVQDGQPKVRLWKDGNEDACLDEKSPLWMDVRLIGADGKPAKELPLKGGYFEVTLPRAFLEGSDARTAAISACRAAHQGETGRHPHRAWRHGLLPLRAPLSPPSTAPSTRALPARPDHCKFFQVLRPGG